MKGITEFIENWLPKSEPLNALDAYTITKYGMRLSKEALYTKCTEEIFSLMQAKSIKNSYSLVFDLDENLPELGKYLEEYYSKLGFNCLILDSTIDKRIETPQLYISWKNAKIQNDI